MYATPVCVICDKVVPANHPRIVCTLQQSSNSGGRARPMRVGHIHGDCWLQLKQAVVKLRSGE